MFDLRQKSTQKQNNTNTKWNKQNKNNKYYLVTILRKLKKKSKSRFTEITTEIEDWKVKFAIFENFTNHGESIRDINRGSREWKKIRRQRKLGLVYRSWKKMVKDKERKQNACVAVKRGVKARRNYNVFNLAMENVLKGLPDKIRDQFSRHHTQMHFKCRSTDFWITFKLRDRGDDR